MMFYPTYHFRSVCDISPEFLLEKGLRRLVLDVDNTLTTHNHPQPGKGVARWLKQLQESGISVIILSNNDTKRVEPFAALLDLPFEADGAKPLTSGYERCRRRFGCEKREMAAIGDQLLTDIWGGWRYGIATLLVDPIEPEVGWFFRLKRALERQMMKSYHRKGRAQYER
ncbi:MAG: YqeG family HAD IIIA-type phosphatase [Provencibacterium sp.]|jgi:HAD superfamily phosphatase (TIGR01668 family)|nr:YqeG family HAD IIIA-type phosphatase [Provencibacterium sp.]